MFNKLAFAALDNDFVESQEFVEIARDRGRGSKFVCHHNSYLVAGFLRRRATRASGGSAANPISGQSGL